MTNLWLICENENLFGNESTLRVVESHLCTEEQEMRLSLCVLEV